MKIYLIVGARPNLIKAAPLWKELKTRPWCETALVHTGQHYDAALSDDIIRQLGLPDPDHHLAVGSGSHAEQTAKIMTRFEDLCLKDRPNLAIVVGDVNSTLACALTAAKLCIPVAHLEAGLRSGDRSMPEEINRLVTDRLADIMWTPSPDADENLLAEGIPQSRITRVGNIMIDSLVQITPLLDSVRLDLPDGVTAGEYGLVTLHRPVNVDDADSFAVVCEALIGAARFAPLVFPVHPRTQGVLDRSGMADRMAAGRITLTKPLPYAEFMKLQRGARFVITDSGGVQEETTYLGIPCLTLRDTTERPVTLTEGTNELSAPAALSGHVEAIVQGHWKKGRTPDLWDGDTAKRVADDLERRKSSF